MPAVGIGKIPAAAAAAATIRGAMMEESKARAHYNHTDRCRLLRWNAREAFEYMYARPWQKVSDYYADLVRDGSGASSLAGLFPAAERREPPDISESSNGCKETKFVSNKDKTGRWERVTFKIVLSYNGGSFDGWQKQPGLNTVQGVVEKSLGIFVDEMKAQQLKDRSLPLEGCAVVAGRTDKGVTALQQVCSFYTWRKDVKSEEIMDVVNAAASGKLRALLISEVSRTFHPNFSAKWRHYFYIFPLNDNEEYTPDVSQMACSNNVVVHDSYLKGQGEQDENKGSLNAEDGIGDDNECHPENKPRSFSVTKVNRLLSQLEGKSLSYRLFARDTKASRSIGPPTECFMFHARAKETKLPSGSQACAGLRVMCVELVANRFLRKMVRVLVATAIREAAAGADDDALIKLMDASCRRATAPPAPPDGLCLVDVGYDEFVRENCLIP